MFFSSRLQLVAINLQIDAPLANVSSYELWYSEGISLVSYKLRGFTLFASHNGINIVNESFYEVVHVRKQVWKNGGISFINNVIHEIPRNHWMGPLSWRSWPELQEESSLRRYTATSVSEEHIALCYHHLEHFLLHQTYWVQPHNMSECTAYNALATSTQASVHTSQLQCLQT